MKTFQHLVTHILATLVSTYALQYLLTRRGPLSLSVNQGGGFFRTHPEMTRPNMQLYMQAFSTVGFAAVYNPMVIATDRRTWSDTNGDDIAQDNEIGPRNSAAFGTATTRTIDPNIVRPFNRFYNVSLDRQVTRGLSVGVGYYRRDFHDLINSRNTLVSLSDYTPRTVANPLGGEALTVYNLNPAKRGLQQIVDQNDPGMKYVYNGFDVNFQARTGKGRIIGGFTTERWVSDACSLDDPNNPILANAYTGSTGGKFCKQSDYDVPFQTQAKLTGFSWVVFGLIYGAWKTGGFRREISSFDQTEE